MVDCDSDEEFDCALSIALCKVARVDCHRVNGYFQQVTTKYLDFEFKRLFRLSRETFDHLCARFRLSPLFPKKCLRSSTNHSRKELPDNTELPWMPNNHVLSSR
ncbi:hypothetical protein HPB48_022600 [Haemaphysalis longicornis]|uniref:Uncharacterized protein n=1 Tax=Haemaphysalis longicornis TaxID=44386 RepID=A0A9J6H4L9_HAELO|nr:hypothetical protein HPB48_022600 [Haemaphysalis longicornis]